MTLEYTFPCGCEVSLTGHSPSRCYCGPEDYCYCYDYMDDKAFDGIISYCSEHSSD